MLNDQCSVDMLLRGILSPFDVLNQSEYWRFFSFKGFYYCVLNQKQKRKGLKFFLWFCVFSRMKTKRKPNLIFRVNCLQRKQGFLISIFFFFLQVQSLGFQDAECSLFLSKNLWFLQTPLKNPKRSLQDSVSRDKLYLKKKEFYPSVIEDYV